jgi:hypothetical protein
VRCGRCGNDNAESNRFCGMCGAVLAPRDQAGGERQGAAAPSAVSSAGAEPRVATMARAETERKSERVISGPSFLGLSTPGPAADGHGHGRDHLSHSGNLDYLLEDDEEPKRGAGKLILILLALALAAGFGYLRWKQGGFDWLNASGKKPAATAPDAGQSADSGGAAGTAARPAETAGGQANTAQDAGQAAAPQNGPVQNSGGEGAAATTSPNGASQNADTSNTASPSTAAAPEAVAPGKPNDSSSSAPSDSAERAASADSESPAVETPAPKAKARKPAAAKPAAARPYDQVAEAERYIYGRGARQDCDHGVRLLKTAAEQSNPQAMISMGALYSTGTCTPRDLPTAYRWFALALHKQPDNQALQDDLKNLWEKMTQPERQLAIKLSQ